MRSSHCVLHLDHLNMILHITYCTLLLKQLIMKYPVVCVYSAIAKIFFLLFKFMPVECTNTHTLGEKPLLLAFHSPLDGNIYAI